MSKMDGLRAMREARYEQAKARGTQATAAPTTRARPAPRPAEVAPPSVTPEPPGDEACGHRAISGRTCTREKGHSAKSHRYS